MDVASFYYLEGGLLFGFLVASGLTVVSLNKPNYRVARRCAWASAILFGSIAVVWGITTMKSAWVQIPAVGIAGLIAAICLSEALRFIKEREFPSILPSAHVAVQRGPTLEATKNSTIDATGAVISGDLPFQFGRADNGSVISMRGAVVTRQGDGIVSLRAGATPVPVQFPPPTGEFSRFSNGQLKAREIKMSADLRDFQDQFTAEIQTLPRQDGTPNDIIRTVGDKYSMEYQQRFVEEGRSIASEMLARITKKSPGATFSGNGGMMLYYGSFAGPRAALDVAVFLDTL